MTPDQAEIIALQALEWLAQDSDLMGVFLGSTGLSREDLFEIAKDPTRIHAVIDFIAQDDHWVLGFCDSIHLPAEKFLTLRATLPGGEAPHWT